MDTAEHQSLAVPTAPWSNRPPSPPTIIIPAPAFTRQNDAITLTPSFEQIDPSFLTAAELQVVTDNLAQQTTRDSSAGWTYDGRRQAQRVLDYLYLGPSSVARDAKWLQDNGITMLLVCRDSRLAQARIMALDRVAGTLGIEAAHIDVSGHQELIRAFPVAIRLINQHILRMAASEQRGGRRGKILLFCETGNDRSASMAIAYLMAVYGADMITACQYVQFSRFCVSLDEDAKFYLANFGDLLSAQRTVHHHHQTAASLGPTDPPMSAPNRNDNGPKVKRGFDDTVDMQDADDAEADNSSNHDRDRYLGREAWLPFR
jgi:serine/threonine/tyrosine-interacting protein